MNIYKTCPEAYNEKFLLRLVSEGDSVDLLKVYSDTKAVPLFNSGEWKGRFKELRPELRYPAINLKNGRE